MRTPQWELSLIIFGLRTPFPQTPRWRRFLFFTSVSAFSGAFFLPILYLVCLDNVCDHGRPSFSLFCCARGTQSHSSGIFWHFLFLARTQLATTRSTSPRVGILIGTCRIVWCYRFSFNYTPSMQAAPAEIPWDDFTIDR